VLASPRGTGALVVLGCGWIARRHAAAARRLRIPVIFASREPRRAATYARRYGGVGAYGSYAEALADPRAVAAVVCTPHDRHLADTTLALAAGKHVLVEKPIARTLAEADQMIARAAEAGRVLMVAEQFHFMPAFRRVTRELAAGRLGELREIHLVVRGLGAARGWRLSAEAVGGGALIDGGIHYVHNLRAWGGGIERVYALRPRQSIAAMEGEDAVVLLASLRGGAVGMLAHSLAAPRYPRLQWATLIGTQGTCFVDNRGRWVALRGSEGARLWLFPRDTRGYVAMLRTFLEAVVAGHAPAMDGVEGRRDLAVVLAAYRSLAEGRPVEPDGAS